MAVLAVLLCGCGVGTQDRPEALGFSETPSASRADDVPSGTADVQVYFVRGTRLEPVVRSATAEDLPTSLEALVAGPGRAEVLAGLRTAIAPETEPTLTSLPDGTVQVDLPRELTGLTGGNQLLAFAQLVWTLTDVPPVRAIRFTSVGAPVEVPTDSGLTGEPVDRADYASVGPPSAAQPSATD
ncbi:GerMN domain-containing protein [Modestobacter altitudinis]|uniref:GerMN domain-containing protein n=1 Tax=Modestobacter altitudinis TaxID=2213158 RepID=UPI00110CCBB6|nr:GerMN domain-containing protein [Modestobacter altitudinis]